MIAAGAPIDIDLSKIAAGQQIVVLWRGAPMLVVNRTPQALKTLQDPGPGVTPVGPELQRAPAAALCRELAPLASSRNTRVLVGICTHLGCLPNYLPSPDPATPAPNWPGGYFCPCHGSKYDLAGRVYSGVPAPYNLPVPPYRFVNDTTVRIGDNPPGETFALTSVVQM